MSWRDRDDRTERWSDRRSEDERTRTRSPVWERDSERHHRDGRRDRDRRERSRERERHDRKDRHERELTRHDREAERHPRENERHRDRDRYRDRDRRRSPRQSDQRSSEIPEPPSPPKISSEGDKKSASIHGSRSRSPEPSENKNETDPKSDPNQDENNGAANVSPGDWYCKCGSYNFKRRQTCYRRNCNGKRSEGVIYSGGEIESTLIMQAGITKRLLFRRLDALTTEEKILDSLKEKCSKKVIDSIVGITIGREPLTGASKCLAYINFNSLADSTAAHTELFSLSSPLIIDGREVLISYYNEPTKYHKAQPTNTIPVDYSSYYAQNYVTNKALSEADRVNAAAAVAQSAISAAQARQTCWSAAPQTSSQPAGDPKRVPTGDASTVYAPPDVRTFMYDESSGYYYDPATGLYYDGNTQYFYNSHTTHYMYWDGATNTYVKAPNGDRPAPHEPAVAKEPEEKKKRDKEDKVKVAKKIAKDMERWAKTLNQKKENARNNFVMEQPLDTGTSKGSADIGFSVLGAGPSPPAAHLREISPPADDDLLSKRAPEARLDGDQGIIDWSRLTCLLCKRKFPSPDVLTKHKTMSDLHKQNLAEYERRTEPTAPPNGYRDRAAERRKKFGEDEPPPRRRFEPAQYAPPPAGHPPPSVVDTIGGKMLQKMGWQEGRGLGKEEQGRVAPVEPDARPGLAGLGQKRGIYTPTPGETYRDTVKKLMIARYKEVVGQEDK